MLITLMQFRQLAAGDSPLLLAASVIIFMALVMMIHEFGHLVFARLCGVPASEIGFGIGPRLCGFRSRQFGFTLRALPVASFVKLDGTALRQRPAIQQILVHLGGVLFNLLAAALFHGTTLGWLNLLLAGANLLPLYKHDGWKCGVVLMRALLRKQSQPVEWVFTFSGGMASLVIVSELVHLIK